MCPLGIPTTTQLHQKQQQQQNISPCSSPKTGSPTPSVNKKGRRPSSALLHPDHARLLALRQQQSSPDQVL